MEAFEIGSCLHRGYYQVISVVDEKFDIIEPIASIKFGQKPSRCLFRGRRKQPEMQDFIRFRTDSAVQPVIVAIDANHFLVDCKLIHTHRRHGL